MAGASVIRSLLRKVEAALAHHLEVASIPSPEMRSMMFDDGSARRWLARELVKLDSWCSIKQRALLRYCEEACGVELSEHITPGEAAIYVEFLRSQASDDDDDGIPL